MNENLIQAITAYAEALEQKMSALEARVGSLQLAVDNLQKENETLKEEIKNISTINYQPSTDNEPEVEIELVIDEEPELLEEPAEESVKEEAIAESIPQEEILEPLEILEPIDDVEETPEVEPVEELVVEEPKVEPVVEQPAPSAQNLSKADTTSAKPTQPARSAQPQQTSLFGTAVEDIRKAISLGDRFLFQRELFGGNGELMQKTLDEINGLDSLNEAMEYIADTFEWDKESTAVQLFENVLKRRFA